MRQSRAKRAANHQLRAWHWTRKGKDHASCQRSTSMASMHGHSCACLYRAMLASTPALQNLSLQSAPITHHEACQQQRQQTPAAGERQEAATRPAQPRHKLLVAAAAVGSGAAAARAEHHGAAARLLYVLPALAQCVQLQEKHAGP